MKTDFLIIGGGLSGLASAIHLSKLEPSAQILVITKESLRDCNTYYAQGGIAVVWSDKDNFEQHVKDTLVAGDGLCDEEIVREIVRQGPDRIQDLIDWGINFTKTDEGKYDLGKEGGHSMRRVLHVDDMTGKSIEETLIAHVSKLDNVQIKEKWCAVNLFSKNLRCYGAYVLDQDKKEILNVAAKATIIAAGGAGKIYLYTTNPDVASGDGIAMAYRAGATVSNMEFYQFHPTCLYHPYAKSFLITEALRGEGAILKDLDGNAFMKKYHPDGELAPRDIVSRAIDAELKKSGYDHVNLDIASYRDAEFIKEHFPGIYEKCLTFGIDITKEGIPVVPAAHYCCGGVKADIDGTTNVKDLYVIGEASCTGLHGANRLASNSLLESLVCSYNCANTLAEREYKRGIEDFPEWEPGNAVPSTEAVVITQNWDEIRLTMQNLVGIERSTERLKMALKRIILVSEDIDRYYWKYRISKDFIELRNIAEVSEIIIRCALSRKESRGTHFTIDYLEKTDIPRTSIIRRPW